MHPSSFQANAKRKQTSWVSWDSIQLPVASIPNVATLDPILFRGNTLTCDEQKKGLKEIQDKKDKTLSAFAEEEKPVLASPDAVVF